MGENSAMQLEQGVSLKPYNTFGLPAVAHTLVRIDGGEIELAFEDGVSAITPGQSLVLYDGERVLGGGFIERGAGARSALPVLAA